MFISSGVTRDGNALFRATDFKLRVHFQAIRHLQLHVLPHEPLNPSHWR